MKRVLIISFVLLVTAGTSLVWVSSCHQVMSHDFSGSENTWAFVRLSSGRFTLLYADSGLPPALGVSGSAYERIRSSYTRAFGGPAAPHGEMAVTRIDAEAAHERQDGRDMLAQRLRAETERLRRSNRQLRRQLKSQTSRLLCDSIEDRAFVLEIMDRPYWSAVIHLPMWPFVLILGGWSATTLVGMARRRFRRARGCVNCEYDLTGNTSGRCPECGVAIEEEQALRKKRGQVDSLEKGAGTFSNSHDA